MQNDLEKYYREKGNLKLKYAALASIGISIVLLLTIAFCAMKISDSTILILRGCAGIFACIFAILVAVMVYRVNAAYAKDKYRKR